MAVLNDGVEADLSPRHFWMHYGPAQELRFFTMLLGFM